MEAEQIQEQAVEYQLQVKELKVQPRSIGVLPPPI